MLSKIPKTTRILLAVLTVIILAAGIYNLPPVHSRLSWRVDNLRTRIIYFFNPPDQAVFVPTEKAQINTPTVSPTPSTTPTVVGVTQTLAPSLTPTITPTPLPEIVELPGVIYVDQHNRWNYCGPANLAMALKFWGWQGSRDDIAKVIKPGINDPKLSFIDRGKTDKNVMPSEMASYVQNETDYNVILRYGGNIDLVKSLISAGFPVLIEKGYFERDYSGKISWMGHYLFVTGYNDKEKYFIVQDAYLKTGKDGTGKNLPSDYQTFIEGWRGFDYLFMVIYPPEKEPELFEVLGPYGNPDWAKQHALDIANQEITTLSGIDLFFAWFNKGTSHVNLLQYADAAYAFDRAFEIYAGLGNDDKQRPYRIMWYQTGPYKAYYYTGRYQDVINLANTTLNDTISDPDLEESLYWRALAYAALGNKNAAESDLRRSIYLNPNFTAGIEALNNLLAP